MDPTSFVLLARPPSPPRASIPVSPRSAATAFLHPLQSSPARRSQIPHPVDSRIEGSGQIRALAGGDERTMFAVRSVIDLPPPNVPSFVSRLLDSEPRHVPQPDYFDCCRNCTRLQTFRQDSISYILQAHAHFRFKPETGWAFHLLLVACLSLAAKMEEPFVPPLLELQRFDPPYAFEPETIQRMELLVLAKINWKLRSATPFDYLSYFISPPSNSGAVYGLASSLILNTTHEIDFLGFPQSVIAASAAITAAGEGTDLLGTFVARINGVRNLGAAGGGRLEGMKEGDGGGGGAGGDGDGGTWRASGAVKTKDVRFILIVNLPFYPRYKL